MITGSTAPPGGIDIIGYCADGASSPSGPGAERAGQTPAGGQAAQRDLEFNADARVRAHAMAYNVARLRQPSGPGAPHASHMPVQADMGAGAAQGELAVGHPAADAKRAASGPGDTRDIAIITMNVNAASTLRALVHERALDGHILVVQELRLIAGPALRELEAQLAKAGWVGAISPGTRAEAGGVSAGIAALAHKRLASEVPPSLLPTSQGRRAVVLLKTSSHGDVVVASVYGFVGQPQDTMRLVSEAHAVLQSFGRPWILGVTSSCRRRAFCKASRLVFVGEGMLPAHVDLCFRHNAHGHRLCYMSSVHCVLGRLGGSLAAHGPHTALARVFDAVRFCPRHARHGVAHAAEAFASSNVCTAE